jgi:hypothetical protein
VTRGGLALWCLSGYVPGPRTATVARQDWNY